MFGRSTSSFDRLLEKATSQLLLEPDWTSNLMICDSIRQGDTNPKYAVTAIKKKFYHQNPHAALFALQVMETCVKNCGDLVHQEIGTKAFMEEMRDLVKQTTDDNIKTKVLEMVQTWGIVFRNHPKYRIISDTHNLMKAEGWKFPPVREADAMFEADIAPDWAEGDVCRRCRVQFSTFTRQHHCRACGQVFCAKCSAKSCLLPKFGIEREVRVCDSCFDQFGPKDETESPQHQAKQPGPLNPGAILRESNLPEEYLSSPLSKQSQAPAKMSGGKDQPAGGGKDQAGAGGKTEAELKEEEELQLVLALSMSEAEEKEKLKKKQTNEMLANFENNKTKVTNGGGAKTPPEETAADPELAKYLNRDYWQSKQDESKDTTGGGGMPAGIALAKQNVVANTARVQDAIQGSGQSVKDTASEAELEEFTTSLRTQLEIFVNRMKSNSSRGRPIANDSSVQSLFVNMMTMHSKLVNHIQVQEDSRLHYEGLQDKLTQVRDARAALDALREEERERRRREAEEAERQRQIQMAYKLDQMRKKKAEYLEYQRQMALKRMADQEREMAMIQDASRKNYMTQQQTMYNMYLPYGQQHGMQPGMFPQQVFPPGMQQQVGMMPGMQGMPQQMPGMMQAPGGPGLQQQPGPGMMGPPPPGHEGIGQPDQSGGGAYHYYGHQQQQQQSGQPGVQDSFNMQGMAGALPAPVTSSTEGNNNGNGQAYTSQAPVSGQSDSGVPTSGGGPMMSQQQAMMQHHQTMSPGMPGQQSGMPGQQPGISSQQPGMQGQQPGMPGQQPGMPGQQPGIPGQQPSMPGQQPGMPGQQPGMPGQQQGIPGQQPGMLGQQPGTMHPGMQHQQPSQPHGMPGMAPGMQQGQGIHQSPGQPGEQNMGAPPPTSQDENSLIVW